MKDPLVFIKHILEAIGKIERFTKDHSQEKFIKDELVQSAVVRQLEIIGEAVKNLPKEFTKKHPDIPWSEIAQTRDKMIHHYFGFDVGFVFKIVQIELPKLKKEIERILANK